MHSQRLIVNSLPDADQVYIQKLRDSIAEMTAMKEAAIKAENYAFADATRSKITALKLQLSKLEDGFHGDILINYATVWQTALASGLGELVTSSLAMGLPTASKKPYQLEFLQVIEKSPLCYRDALLRSFLILLPFDSPSVPKSPYGWDTFLKKISEIPSAKGLETLDLIKSLSLLSFTDCIIKTFDGVRQNDLKRETLYLLLRYALFYLRMISSRKSNVSVDSRILEAILHHWALIIGFVADFERSEVMRQATAMLEYQRKTPIEEVSVVLSALKYIFAKPKDVQSGNDYALLMKELLTFFDNNKKTAARVVIIQTLERMIAVVDITTEQSRLSYSERDLWEIIMQVHKKARKWLSTSDLCPSASLLIASLLTNCPSDYFEMHFEAYLQSDLISKKMKGYIYECTLKILRGRYIHESLLLEAKRLHDYTETGIAYAFLMRPKYELKSPATLLGRLELIANIFFLRRQEPIDPAELHICAEIVLQICAHSISYGLQLLEQFLDMTRNTTQNVDLFYIGIRVLRKICDPESGFQKRAASSTDEEFTNSMKTLPIVFAPKLVALYDMVNREAGTGVYGKANSVTHPIVFKPINAPGSKPDKNGLDIVDVLSEVIGKNSDAMSVAMTSLSLGNDKSRLSLMSPLHKFVALASNNKPALPSDEVNDKILRFLSEWIELSGDSSRRPSDFRLDPSVVKHTFRDALSRQDPQLVSRPILYLETLKELVRLTPFVSLPEFLGGHWFLGHYLNHSDENIRFEASNSLQLAFSLNAHCRVSIIRGFLQQFKVTEERDDASILSFLLHLMVILQSISKDPAQYRLLAPPELGKVSCKLDAVLIQLLGRSSIEIRKTCVTLLILMQRILDDVRGALQPGELTLLGIIVEHSDAITKEAYFYFGEQKLAPNALEPGILAGLESINFFEALTSDYGGFYRFFFGSLVTKFAFFGRHKSIRHTGKYLRQIVIPQINSVKIETAQLKFDYTSNIILLLGLCGATDISETKYSLTSIANFDKVLYNGFRHMLPNILNSDENSLLRSFVDASCYIHPAIRHLFVYHLYSGYMDGKKGDLHYFENTLAALQKVSAQPDFHMLVSEAKMTPVSPLGIYADFLDECEQNLIDTGFIVRGPSSRMQAAIDYVILLRRIAILHSQGKTQDPSFAQRWNSVAIEAIFVKLQRWDSVLKELKESPGDITSGSDSSTRMQTVLEIKLAQAVKAILTTDMNFKTGIPDTTLYWLIDMERRDMRILGPAVIGNYESTLGLILAESYGQPSGRYNSFTHILLEQLIPKINTDPTFILTGKSKRLSYAEDFCALIHLLAPSDIQFTSETIIYEKLGVEAMNRVKRHIGSLLFFGLFNMLNIDKIVRIRSLLFVKRIFEMFNTSTNLDVPSFFASFSGAFYSNVSIVLEGKILEISLTAADVFSKYSSEFLFEAVRCSRCLRDQQVLSPPQKWIMQIILPWCRYVHFDFPESNPYSTEIFKYFLDMAYFDGSHTEQVTACWSQIAKNAKNGIDNIIVMTDATVQVCAKLEQSRSMCLELITKLAEISCPDVGKVLVHILSAAAFPWNQQDPQKSALGIFSANQKQAKPIIKEYVSNLCIALDVPDPEGQSQYTLSCRSAALLVSELLVQQFSSMISFLPVLLNFVVLHVPTYLQDDSISTLLLKTMAEGFIGVLHASRTLKTNTFKGCQEKIQKLLSWYEVKSCKIDFSIPRKNQTPAASTIQVPVFLNVLTSIFETLLRTMKVELLQENVAWATEGFLGPDQSIKAIRVYTTFHELESQVPAKLSNYLTSRLLDQLSILKSIESELRTARLTGPDKWESMPEGKKKLKADAEHIIMNVMCLHQVVIKKTPPHLITSIQELFWASVGLLNLSANDFPSVYSMALETVKLFLEKGMAELHKSEAILKIAESLGPKYRGLQPIVLQTLFSTQRDVQKQTFYVLILSWGAMHDYITDPCEFGYIYTLLYTTLFIFANIDSYKDSEEDASDLKSIMGYFKSAMAIKIPSESEDLKGPLVKLIEIFKTRDISTTKDALFKNFVAGLFKIIVPTYMNNAVEFLSQALFLSPEYQRVAISLIQLLWEYCLRTDPSRKNTGSLESLIRKLPFVQVDATSVVGSILDDQMQDMVKDIDVASQGKVPILPSKQEFDGSIQRAGDWLVELGFSPSNKMFVWT